MEYYKQIVLEETLPEDIELADILKKAKELHEYLKKNYNICKEKWRSLFDRHFFCHKIRKTTEICIPPYTQAEHQLLAGTWP